MAVKKKFTFQDELIQQIKDAGQELINRADTMVHPNLDFITNYSINIRFDLQHECYPEITFTTSVINKSFIDRMMGEEKTDE